MTKTDSKYQILVESQIIRRNHEWFPLLDDLAFKAKNVRNATVYAMRQYYFEHNIILTHAEINAIFIAENNVDYRALPAKVSGQIQRKVYEMFKSFQALKELQENGEYDKPVKLPGYLNSVDGRFAIYYDKQALSLTKPGFIKLSKTDIYIPTKVPKDQIRFVEITPKNDYFIITIGYRVEVEKKEAEYERVAFVDPGLNNLMTVTSTEFEPIIYNGRPLKSINQYYNKQKALEVSRLETRHGQKTSHQTRTLDRKRKHKIKDYCHKATTDLVNQLVSHGVQTLVFGHNTGQKQDINLGKRTNQNFVNIPFTLLIHMLEYKCRVNGIHFVVHEESHTSKCSFIDQESIEHHEDYLGRRIKRGLFESLLGKKYNSDVNGSLNIGRKYLTTINKYTIEMHNKLLSMMGNPRVRTV